MAKQRLSVQETARSLGITLDAVYRLCKAGKIESKKRKNGEWSIARTAVVERKDVKARQARRTARRLAKRKAA